MKSLQGGSVDIATYDIWYKSRWLIPRKNIVINYSPDVFSSKMSEYDSEIQQNFQIRQLANPSLFNGLKFRLCSVNNIIMQNEEEEEQEEEEHLQFGIGLCDYSTYLGTNRNSNLDIVQLIKNEGLTKYQDEYACFANPFGNAALIITKDDCIPIFQRSFKTAEFALWWDIPGGHPEPSRIGLFKSSKKEERDWNSLILDEFFESIRDEVRTELNIPFEYIKEPYLIGIVKSHASRGRPSAVFFIPINLTSNEISTLYEKGGEEAEESTVLVFVSKKVGMEGNGEITLVTKSSLSSTCEVDIPKTFEEIKNKLVPTASFAFDALHWMDMKEEETINSSKKLKNIL